MICGDKRCKRGADRFLVDRVLHIEVEATLLCADVAAGHAVVQNRAKQVHRGMHTHVPVAAIPVNRKIHAGADGRTRGAVLKHVGDVSVHITRVDDSCRTAVP